MNSQSFGYNSALAKCAESGACLAEFHTPLVLLVDDCLLCEQETVAVEFMEVFVVVSVATVSEKNRTVARPL